MKKNKLTQYGLLLAAMLVYSCSSLCIKISANYPMASLPFLLWYGGSIGILVVYAVLWQIVLKHVELSRAYAVKPLTLLLSVVWGIVLFQEEITGKQVIALAIILLGIRMVVSEHDE